MYRLNRQHSPPFLATEITRRPTFHRHQVLLCVPTRVGRKTREGKSPLRVNSDRSLMRVGRKLNLQTVYGGHGSLSGGNLHQVRMMPPQRRKAGSDAQGNIAMCWPDFCDEGITSAQHLLVGTFSASDTHSKPLVNGRSV